MGVSPADKLKFSTASELELIQQCLRGSNVVLPAATLQYLFDALRDLFTQADPHELNQNLALARSITSQLALIVGTGAEVPPSTFEKLVAAREMLQAGVQETRGLPADERSTPAGRGDGSSDVAAGNGALLPDGAQRYTDAGDEAQQLRFVVEKMAAGATQFKVNKLHQLLAALVKESVVLPALTATKKALDPTLRGYIEVRSAPAPSPLRAAELTACRPPRRCRPFSSGGRAASLQTSRARTSGSSSSTPRRCARSS
jgi:hypothetical protein